MGGAEPLMPAPSCPSNPQLVNTPGHIITRVTWREPLGHLAAGGGGAAAATGEGDTGQGEWGREVRYCDAFDGGKILSAAVVR
jgi:hypothetical protein